MRKSRRATAFNGFNFIYHCNKKLPAQKAGVRYKGNAHHGGVFCRGRLAPCISGPSGHVRFKFTQALLLKNTQFAGGYSDIFIPMGFSILPVSQSVAIFWRQI
jgi:hypothetical protein